MSAHHIGRSTPASPLPAHRQPRGLWLVLLAVAVLVTASAPTAQTTQLLQKAIHTQETMGDLVGAVRMYRQIIEARFAPREVAAQAQLRLGEVLARMGQTSEAEREFESLTLEHPEYKTLVSRVWRRTASGAEAAQNQEGPWGLFSGNYDAARAVSVTGKVTKMKWVNPLVVLTVEGSDGNRWGFTIAPPNYLIRLGWSRSTVTLGEEVLVSAFLARGEGEPCEADRPISPCAEFTDGSLHAFATTITLSDGRIIMNRSTRTAP